MASPNTVGFGMLADPQQEDIERRMRLAEALRKTSMDPMEMPGAAPGGVAVRASPFAGLAKLVQAYGAGKMQDEAKQDALKLADQQRTERAGDLAAVIRYLKGAEAVPEQTFQTGANEMGDDAAMQTLPGRPAQPPNPMAAIERAAMSRSPDIQHLGTTLATSYLPKQPKWEKFDRPDGKGGMEHGYIDVNSPQPLNTFQNAGLMPAKREYVNGQGVNPYTGETQGAAIPKQLALDSVVMPGPGGGLVPNPAVIEAKSKIAAAGKPSINQTVLNSGPKAFETELGKLDAEQLGKWRSSAETATHTLGTVQNLRAAASQGAYAGAGADAKLAGAKWVQAFTGATPRGMVGSELYNAESKKLILDHIKALGANPSNADREFIEKTVPQLATSAQARALMTNWMEQKARTQLELYRQADAYARKNHGLGGFDPFGRQGAGPGGGPPTGRTQVSNW